MIAAHDKNELKQRRDYLDQVLKEKKISDEDLKELFESRVTAWGLPDGENAREFFEGLRETVKEKAKKW